MESRLVVLKSVVDLDGDSEGLHLIFCRDRGTPFFAGTECLTVWVLRCSATVFLKNAWPPPPLKIPGSTPENDHVVSDKKIT